MNASLDIPFEHLPFEAQKAWIRSEVDAGRADEVLRRCAALADAEPLVETLRCVERTSERGLDLASAVAALPDAALATVFSADLDPHTLARLADDALRTWSPERASGLAFLARWVRQNAPERWTQLQADALARTATPPGAGDGRWLLYLDGHRLTTLAADPAWQQCVASTVSQVVDALSRAPKSISQTNAEAVLARRVYADPGHFFFELLQNADDAGASTWSVDIDAERIVVEHDGAPFSFLDLVGVLSIGQTTKSAEQIGFFGVGFKSVYEVCTRPRITSGVFDVEIAQVSIPRTLHGSGPTLRTRLCLPLEPHLDARALEAQALRIPPETLLMLPEVDAYEVRGPSGTARWQLERDGASCTLAGTGAPRRYRLTTAQASYQGARELGRLSRSPVQIAVAVDAEGRPRAAEGGLFAFLPIAAHTGLRVLVHARFDVTLDRERLELDSPWNETLLAAAGRALAAAAIELAELGHSPLAVLSARDELAPSMAPLHDALIQSLMDQPCLPSQNGFVAPRAAIILPAELQRSLEHLILGDLHPLCSMSEREARVVRDLGVEVLGREALLRWASTELVAGATPPPWLDTAVLGVMASAERDALQDLALCVAGSVLCRPREARVASQAMATLYDGVEGSDAVVSRRWIDAHPALASKLALPAFDAQQLIDDLRGARALALLEEARASALLDALEPLGVELLAQLDDLPILRNERGERCAARSLRTRPAWLDASTRAAFEGVGVSLTDELAQEHAQDHAHERLARRWLAPLGFDELVTKLEVAARDSLSRSSSSALVETLDRLAPRLERQSATRLAALSIFADSHGELRPLRGEGHAWTTRDDSLRHTLVSAPWARRGAFVDSVAELDMHRDRVALVVATSTPPWSHEALEALAQEPGALSEHAKRALERAPLWMSQSGARRLTTQLRRGDPDSPAITAAYARGPRELASAAALRAYDAMGLASVAGASLPEDDRLALVQDVASAALDVRAPHVRGALRELCELPASALSPLRERPWLEDESGQLRVAADWHTDDEGLRRAGAFRALLQGHVPLVQPHDEADFGPLLDAMGLEPAQLADVLSLADDLDPEALLETLESRESLSERERLALESLPLFADRAAGRRRCTELSDGSLFDAEGAEDDDWGQALASSLLSKPHAKLCRRLGLRTRPVRDVIASVLLAEPGTDPRHLHRLVRLCRAADLDPRHYPLALDVSGAVTRPPLLHGPAPQRALAMTTSLGRRVADASWAADADPQLLTPIENTDLAKALKGAFPHPSAREPEHEDALVQWLLRERAALDDAALDALRHAAVFPSQGTERVRITSLVLDPDIPDMGIAWGLAPSVPLELAGWLSRSFEPDRHTRRELVQRVLEALDDAVTSADERRAFSLLAFIGRVLGAEDPSVSDEELALRARRLDVRQRARVPTDSGRWLKPRFAWLPGHAGAERFATGIPPVITVDRRDAATSRLLLALGAQTRLSDAQLRSLLEQLEGKSGGDVRLVPGPTARRALATYLLHLASDDPASVERLGLRTRAFVPDTEDQLRAPSELVWPQGHDHLLGKHPRPAIVDAVEAILDDDAVRALRGRLGFRAAHDLPPSAYSPDASSPLSLALLDFIEEQLRAARWTEADVRTTFREAWLLDTGGVPRQPRELARADAEALFGQWRGEFPTHPKTATALGIPGRPDEPMIARFLVEIGQQLEQLDGSQTRDLLRRVPACWAALDAAAARLPPDAVIAAEGIETVLVRRSDPRLAMAQPPQLAEQLPLDAILDPLPAHERSESLRGALLALGIPDLHAKLRITRVDPGPDEPLQEEALALHASLRPLGRGAGAAIRWVSSLLVEAQIDSHPLSASLPAALHEDTLWVTTDALRDPSMLAPVLAPSPQARAAMERWLLQRPTRAPELPSKSAQESSRDPAPARPKPGPSLWESLKARFTGGPATSSTHRISARSSDRGFEQREVIRPQLAEIEGFSEARLQVPDFGFAFEPKRLPEPWLYAPQVVAADFRRGAQSWAASRLERPAVRGESGLVRMRGRLPAGRSVLPVPHYARVSQIRASDGEVEVLEGRHGEVQVELARESEVHLEMICGSLPSLVAAQSTHDPRHLEPTVPDRELPDEVHDFISELRESSPTPAQIIADVRAFIRSRYRYDPSYLEDPSVGRWLLRVTRGRESQAMATLHAGADGRHLGAGVCFELGHLACELMRRAGLSAGVATGWVLSGGQVSVPDHLWAVAFMLDAHGRSIWVPVDAATTDEGRPLRVPQRAPGDFRAPKPPPPAKQLPARTAAWSHASDRTERSQKKPKKVRAPRRQWFEVLRWLENTAGRQLTARERKELLDLVDDPKRRAQLLEWLSPRR